MVKGKRWLLLSRWVNIDAGKKRHLNKLFAFNRRVMKAYLLKESLDRLWTYPCERAMLRISRAGSISCWQRLKPFEKLAQMLLDHLEGILNSWRTNVPMGVVQAVNGNIKSLLRRGRGYKNLPLSTAESSADGSNQDRIRRAQDQLGFHGGPGATLKRGFILLRTSRRSS